MQVRELLLSLTRCSEKDISIMDREICIRFFATDGGEYHLGILDEECFDVDLGFVPELP